MIRFGPSGGGIEFEEAGLSSIMQVPDFIKAKGLNAFEYSFGHGYQMKTESAAAAGKLFKDLDIKLSLHAPYYINFANPDEIMYEKSVGYITTGLRFMKAFDYCDHFVFHSGSCGALKREDALKLITQRFHETFDKLEESGVLADYKICPETMGKPMQIGTPEEVIELCTINPHLVPTFDFGHINALGQGCLKTKEDYLKILELSIEKLGFERTKDCHIHFSKIEYGAKGEIRHLDFDDSIYGPDYEPMLETVYDLKLEPRIISESRDMQPRDALIMKKYYEKISK